MAKYNRKEFAVFMKMEAKNVSTYIGRTKIYKGSDGLIDTEHQINKYFIEKRNQLLATRSGFIGNASSEPEIKSNSSNVPSKKPETSVQNIASNPSLPFPEVNTTQSTVLDNQIKENKLAKEKLQTELLQQDLAKKSGEVIPTELVLSVLTNHSRSIAVAFRHASDNLLIVYSKKLGIQPKDVSDMRVKLVDVINAAVSESVDISTKQIENIVTEYRQKRGVGEKIL